MKNKRNKLLDRRLFGLSALNQFSSHNSASRSVMYLSQLSQALALSKPQNRILLSGLESEANKSSLSKKLPAGAKILDIIEYFGPYENNIDSAIYTDILYYNSDKNEVDSVHVELWDKMDKKYGFEHTHTSSMEELREGDVTHEEIELTKTNSNIDDMYAYGTNLALMSVADAGVAEDAIIISESAAKKLEFYTYETTRFSVGEKSVPMNTHGNLDNYKIIPDVGEDVGDSGILLATRTMEPDLFGILFSNKDMMNPDPTFDRVYGTVHSDGVVVDIDVIHTPKNLKYPMYEKTYNQIDDYAKSQSGHRERIIERSNYWISQYRGSKAGNTLHPLLINAMRIESPLTTNLYKRDEMHEYTVEITVRYKNTPTLKHKLTTIHGSKGIVSGVRPDNEMPIDKNGIRSEILMNPNSSIHRMNLGGKYEGEFSTATYLVSKYVKSRVSGNKLNDNLVNELYTYVLGFVKLFGNEQYDVFNSLVGKDRKRLISSICKDELRIYLPIDNPKRFIDIAIDLLASQYRPIDSGFTITNGEVDVESTRNGMCEMMYIFLLNKTGDIGLSVSSSKLNHFGLPAAPNAELKKASVYNGAPTKILSETETRLVLATAGQEALAELRNRSLNHDSHYTIYQNILGADKPTNIEDVIDRSLMPIEGDVPLKIFTSILNTMGLKFKTRK